MNKKTIVLMSIIVVIFASAIIALFFAIFEQREEEQDIGLTGEAVFNPLFFARRFLENSGVESESVVSLLELKKMPEQKDILFIATRRFDIGPVLRKKIMTWVASGGHLIIVARPQNDTDSELEDPILSELEISVYQYDFEGYKNKSGEYLNCKDKSKNKKSQTQKDPDSEQQETKSLCKEIIPVSAVILQQRQESAVAFNPSIWLESNSEQKVNWRINGETGAQLIEYTFDKGFITVLSDYQFLTNAHFNKFDHAAFFWYLVHYSNNRGKVWMVYRGDMPPLYVWLAEHLWAPFMVLFFIIFIWIWSVLPRFGAMYPGFSVHRRNLIEHIQSSGQFLWKNKFSEDLIHETRNALQEQISKRHPNWNKLTNTELATRLARQSGLSIDAIEFAFSVQQTKKEHEFFLIIQTLERLRKSI